VIAVAVVTAIVANKQQLRFFYINSV